MPGRPYGDRKAGGKIKTAKGMDAGRADGAGVRQFVSRMRDTIGSYLRKVGY